MTLRLEPDRIEMRRQLRVLAAVARSSTHADLQHVAVVLEFMRECLNHPDDRDLLTELVEVAETFRLGVVS